LNVFIGTLPGLMVDAPDLVAGEEQELGGVAPYHAFSGIDLPAQPVTITLEGLLAEGEADPRADNARAQPGIDSGLAQAPPQLAAPVATALMPDWIVYALAGAVGTVLLGVLAWTALSGAARRE